MRLPNPLFHAVNAYLLAKTYHDFTRDRVTSKVDDPLLATYSFVADRDPDMDHGEPLRTIRDLYRTADSDRLDQFYEERGFALAELGYDDLKPGQCPILIAGVLQTEAEHAIILATAEMAQFEGITVNRLLCAGLDTYQKFIDLAVKMTMAHPDFVPPKVAA